MNWQHVLWIWRREMRDQLRDRRTLFMVAVLPVLMYPLLGTSMFQLAQFMRESTGVVAVYGAEELSAVEGLPTLLEEDRFAQRLFNTVEEVDRLVVERRETDGDPLDAAGDAIAGSDCDVAVCFPSDFAERLNEVRDSLNGGDGPEAAAGVPTVEPSVLFNSAVSRLKWRDFGSMESSDAGGKNWSTPTSRPAASRPWRPARSASNNSTWRPKSRATRCSGRSCCRSSSSCGRLPARSTRQSTCAPGRKSAAR